jgi:hypothetical protein
MEIGGATCGVEFLSGELGGESHLESSITDRVQEECRKFRRCKESGKRKGAHGRSHNHSRRPRFARRESYQHVIINHVNGFDLISRDSS